MSQEFTTPEKITKKPRILSFEYLEGYADYMNGEDFNHDYSDSYEGEYNRGWLKAKRDCIDSKGE